MALASSASESELARRLALLLVFRVVTATLLLGLTSVMHWRSVEAGPEFILLYAVAVGSYIAVLVLALLLRGGFSPVVLGAAYLAGSGLVAAMVVYGTGVVRSEFTFLFFMAVLDAAIIGARPAALAMATAASLLFGAELALQVYAVVPLAERPSDWAFVWSFVVHSCAFYLSGLVAGHLAELLRRARSNLVEMQERVAAQAHLASLGEMAAGIAHELRNPLAAISGSLELLGEEGDPHKANRLRSIALREIERLNALVEDILIYARPAPPERQRMDVAAMLQEIASVTRADAALAGRTLNIKSPASLHAELDPHQLRQVLWNLLRNALEASPLQSEVELGVEEQVGRGGRSLVFWVRDHGPGVDPQIRPHLFEPFRTTKSQGTGLGLAIVARIVENHRGRVELQTVEGGGTRALVVLPA